MDDLVAENYSRIGEAGKISAPGQRCGHLDPKEAKKMNLDPEKKVPVAVSLIDAHAGALGMLAIHQAAEIRRGFKHQLGIIAGTSSCHMILNDQPIFVPGIWGPYKSAILSKFWLHEGGQSAVGSLLDHIIETHPASGEAKTLAVAAGLSIQGYLHHRLLQLASGKDLTSLTSGVHVWPDFHGNRCPLADPNLKGMVSGLTMDKSMDDLAVKFLATLQAVAYGTRLIVDEMTK